MYNYKGYQLVSTIIDKTVVPARVGVNVWKDGSDRQHDAPCYVTTSLDLAIRWVDQTLMTPEGAGSVIPASRERLMACW